MGGRWSKYFGAIGANVKFRRSPLASISTQARMLQLVFEAARVNTIHIAIYLSMPRQR